MFEYRRCLHNPKVQKVRLRTFVPLCLFQVDAAQPRLGRAFQTAPISCQIKPKTTLALTALSLTPCHPHFASV